MRYITYDKKYQVINFAYQTLEFMGVWNDAKVKINVSYITAEQVGLNFHFKGKRYYFAVNVETMECEIWNSHNKHKILVKEKYTDTDIIRAKFVK